MAQRLMTPGVYIEEKNAFPGSVVEVATAIPAFIGYTEKAERNGRSLVNKPTRITSFADYMVLFGGAFQPKFTLKVIEKDDKIPRKHKVTISGLDYEILYNTDNELYMFRSIQLFFANGGGTCYIVPVGTYGNKSSLKVKKAELLGENKTDDDKIIEGGLDVLLKEQEPTMIVIPDAVKLEKNECYALYSRVLAHCAKMQSRVAIFDVHNGDGNRIVGKAEDGDVIAIFREKIGTEFLNYGAAYYPWLNTSVLPAGEITFKNLGTDLKTLLPKEEKAAKSMLENFISDPMVLIGQLMTTKEESYKQAITADGPSKPAYPLSLVEPKPVLTDPTPVVTDPPVVAQPAEGADTTAYDEFLVAKDAFTTYKKLKDAFDEYDKAKTAFDTEVGKNQVVYDAYKTAILNDAYRSKYDTAFANAINDKTFTDISAGLSISTMEGTVKTDYELENFTKLLKAFIANKERNHHLGLIATSPTYGNLLTELTGVENLLPPSAAMAGLYTMVDNTRGVWKSPANVSVNSVIMPSSNITHDDQENLNVDAMSGKSINAIRTFPGIGTLVWGGRTLDGNSLDWQYVNVRRTMIMLEQSIKLALRSYVFEPNDANTWVTVKSMIINFLTEKWKQGALAGASPDDAFSVDLGLGSTMTSLDILEGKMLVSVKLAIVRPAEFIVVTFEQQMQKS